MKQNKARRTAYIACCAMLAGALGTTAAYAANDGIGHTEEPQESPASEEMVSADSEQPVKNETVYVLADANGSTNKVIVSDWLRNVNGADTISEESVLRNIENVGGSETFTENGDIRTWNASGSDIYYQGTTNADLPLKIKVTYYLNGSEISAADILGKSGRVTVRFDYENLQKTVKEINGEEADIYVPFAAITGMMLDNDIFRNIEVTNGRLVNDGNRTFIVGTAFPGLPESLGIQDSDKLNIPEYFEITADADGFSIGNTMTIATNELFSDIDIDLGDEESAMLEDVDKLKDAMDQIIYGSGQLYDGLSELLEKSSALTDGVGALYDGAAQLNNGTAALYDGAARLSEGAYKANDGAAQLYGGSLKLTEGLGELTASNATLTAGSEQVFNSLLDMANTQLEDAGITGHILTIENYRETLDEIISSLENGGLRKIAEENARKQVTEAVEAKRDMVRTEVEKAVKAQAEAGTSTQMPPDEIRKIIEDTTDARIAELIEENLSSEEVQKKIEAGTESAKKSVTKLYALKESLDSYNTFYTGLAAYTDGVAQAADGAAQIKDGLSELGSGTAALADGAGKLTDGAKALSDGSEDLYNGIGELDSKIPALIDGITRLKDGSGKLSEGCVEFNEQGITKITDLADGELGSIADRLKALKAASDDYETFTGGTGSAKFVYRTEAIE